MCEASLYVGPSAFGLDLERHAAGRYVTQPPAGRGDVDRLIGTASHPGVIVLCDGVFQSRPAVSHAELCRALDLGWQVWGVSSMGAIRAYELRFEGMHGFGYVHDLFARVPDLADDEMALLHFPESPWFPVTEALVNVRYAFDRLKVRLALPDAVEDAVIAALQSIWFGDRTEQRIGSELQRSGVDPRRVSLFLAWLRRHRAKTIDLHRLMSVRPWER